MTSTEWFVKFEPSDAPASVDFFIEMPSLFQKLKSVRLRQYKLQGHQHANEDAFCVLDIPEFVGSVVSNDSVADGRLAVFDVVPNQTLFGQQYSPVRPLVHVPVPLRNMNRLRCRLLRPNGAPVSAEALYLWFDLIF